jgi:high-affinity iron transporter
MLPSFILALREGLEAALIIGIVLGSLQKMDRQDLNLIVWIGTASALAISFLTALVLNLIGTEFEGLGEMMFEGFTMLFAAGLLSWMIFWMQRQAHSMKARIESDVQKAAVGKGQKTIFLLAFLAVVREGVELALFLLAARLASNPGQELLGALLGLCSAALLGWILFASTRQVSLTRFFQSTNVLLIVFAAGLIGLGVHEFNEMGWIPTIIDHVWNLNAVLSDESILGQVLKALVGYNSSPSLSQLIAYLGYFTILGTFLWKERRGALTPTA